MNVIDQQQRDEALDPNQSFIVQAPAGSGKTELLVQRYLKLLTQAKKPEAIVALTFTRKAAAEMQTRICKAVPDINPSRLRIMTIDALCAALTRQMPVLSRFGAPPDIAENAEDYYFQAARTLLMTLETEQSWSPALQKLLLHLNNDYQIAENLLVKMLARRDQWLHHILAAKNLSAMRNILEQSLAQIVTENLENCYRLFPENLTADFLDLIKFAANNLKTINPNAKILACSDLQQLPLPALESKQQWLGIASLLLTQTFQWRKKLTVNEGFPSDSKNEFSKNMKQKMQELLIQLQHHHEGFRQSLQDFLESPTESYSQQQWEIVDILVEILPVLAAHLTLIFREHNTVDFIEISSAAITALGSPEAPSELALNLDYQIQHLLVDEFQDTSISQFKLLELLTTGWQHGDGRTLFLVGDPMQSIYRFREAEVGLFLRARLHGIGYIKLKSIVLSVNFRSQINIINWINQNFPTIFPATENIVLGAVPFIPCTAVEQIPEITADNSNQQVNLHPFIKNSANNDNQINKIIEIINASKKFYPKQTIAILVRSRLQLQKIIPALKNAGIKFQGVEIEKLSEHAVIQDLFALTRALLHPADRIAWLAILRAPWCGLTLTDMHILANNARKTALWEAFSSHENINELSADARQRLSRILPILKSALHQRQRYSLRKWVETTWRALGGPACVEQEMDLIYAQTFFDLLDESKANDEMDTVVWLEKNLTDIYAPPDYCADNSLQIMTIHKAKGLEFDTVILPMLETKPHHDEQQLLMWMERPRANSNESDLILAPIKSIEIDEDPIYHYLRLCESKKSNYENARLFYVTATRARRNLHLLASVECKSEDKLELPPAKSFLRLLWPQVEKEFLQLIPNDTEFFKENVETNQNFSQSIRRLKTGWQIPDFLRNYEAEGRSNPGTDQLILDTRSPHNEDI